jgi:hypothetical protein
MKKVDSGAITVSDAGGVKPGNRWLVPGVAVSFMTGATRTVCASAVLLAIPKTGSKTQA